MTKLKVFQKNIFCGVLEKTPEGYLFTYDAEYYINPKRPPVALTIPKTSLAHESAILFPFFFGLLAEGSLKAMQCILLRIDENDHFERLRKTATIDTIGSVRVELFEDE